MSNSPVILNGFKFAPKEVLVSCLNLISMLSVLDWRVLKQPTKSQSVVFLLNFMKCVVSSQHLNIKQTILQSWFVLTHCVGDALTNAVGLLKEEMRRLGSLILESAEATRVPAGGALAVDRDGFSRMVTEKIANHPLIEVVRDEITELPTDAITVVATGPLTSDALAE